MMTVYLNQHPVTLEKPVTLTDFLQQHPAKEPFAVALNTVFVSKEHYSTTPLADGDAIEIVHPVAGG